MRKISSKLAALVFGTLFTVMQVSAAVVQEDSLFLENTVYPVLEEMCDDVYYDFNYDMAEEDAIVEDEAEFFAYAIEEDEFTEIVNEEFLEDESYDSILEAALWEGENEFFAYAIEEDEFTEIVNEEFLEDESYDSILEAALWEGENEFFACDIEYDELVEEIHSDYTAEERMLEKYI